MTDLTSLLTTFWNTQAGLPSLWFNYIPSEEWATVPFPVVVFGISGFNRDQKNGGVKFDNWSYEFTVFDDDPITVFTKGNDCLQALNNFEASPIYMSKVKPEEMATPANLGGRDVWTFRFSVTLSTAETGG